MDTLELTGEVFIIKPNWVDGVEGSSTGAKILEFIFDYLKDKKVFIIESYTIWRNQKYIEEGIEEIPPEKGNIIDAKEEWVWIRNQDEWFLENNGIRQLLDKYNVKYINITEEVWSGRTVNETTIRELVEKKFNPVKHKELYSYIPKKLYELRGSTLISLSKLKTGQPGNITASTKNVFGLIPDPSRWPKYHGENDNELSSSIIDANKIYRSLFNTIFIAEGIFSAVCGNWPDDFEVIKNWGQIVGGTNSVEVDAIIATLIGLDYNNITYLPPIIEEFGDFDKSKINDIPQEYYKPIKLP